METYQSSFICKKCSNPTVHFESYDAYVCGLCNSWNEKQCSDNECYYCVNRPEKPFNEYENSIFIKCYEELGINATLWLIDDYLEEK